MTYPAAQACKCSHRLAEHDLESVTGPCKPSCGCQEFRPAVARDGQDKDAATGEVA